MKIFLSIGFVVLIFLYIPVIAHAGDLTLPLNTTSVNSWFDHIPPFNCLGNCIATDDFQKYDGTIFTNAQSNLLSCVIPSGNCYNGHDAIDFQAASGTPVLAATAGTVQLTGYQAGGAGNWIRIWHSQDNYSTFYAHLSQILVATGMPVTRGQLIGKSGRTGCDVYNCGAHLHFGVYNSITAGNQIDPYGWTAGQNNDPYVPDREYGYLWTTNPPSHTPPGTYVHGNIATSTTWTLANSPYVIQGGIQINAGATLTIEPGVVVKFDMPNYNYGARLYILGTVIAEGTATQKIYFTSFRDDTVAGDTNGDGSATSPHARDWSGLYFRTGSHGTISNAVFRYGGFRSDYPDFYEGALTVDHAEVSAQNTLFEHNFTGAEQKSGSLILDGDQFLNNDHFGVYTSGDLSTTTTTVLNLQHSQFGGNADYDAYVFGHINFVNWFNTPVGTTTHGFYIIPDVYEDQFWDSGLPFIVAGGTIRAGAHLVLYPKTILKFEKNTDLYVYGAFKAEGKTNEPITITSYRDDSAGGDTNRDGSTTNPAPGDYFGFHFQPGSEGSFSYANIRYGGYYNYGYNYNGLIKNNGGDVSVSNSDIYLNKYPIYQTAGTTTITYSIIRNNADYGIYAYVNGGYIPTSVAVYGTQFGGNALADTYMSGNVHFENENNAPYQSLPVRGFQIAGTSYSDEVWNPGIPYVISGLGVSANHSLTIQPGTIVKFMTRASIGVNGTLAAIGSQAKKIYFTSLNDDSVGGDTNGTSTQPTSTDYLGLNFSSGSRGTISNAVLRYGGYYNIGTLSVGALRNLGGVVQIDRSRFTNNYYGIYQTSGTTTVAQSSIADNTMYGIYNQYQNPYAPSLSAIGNWWGSATGPFHPTANPNGTGNRVSDRVQFAPWLSSDPTAMGEPGEQCIPGGC